MLVFPSPALPGYGNIKWSLLGSFSVVFFVTTSEGVSARWSFYWNECVEGQYSAQGCCQVHVLPFLSPPPWADVMGWATVPTPFPVGKVPLRKGGCGVAALASSPS